MTAQAVKVELYGQNNDGDRRRYTIASDAAVAKGDLLILTSPRTASVTGGASGAMFAGVAAEAHDGLDFSTSITAYTNGIFDIVGSAAISAGEAVILDGNSVLAATNLGGGISIASGAQIVGIALEDAGAAEVINVRINI